METGLPDGRQKSGRRGAPAWSLLYSTRHPALPKPGMPRARPESDINHGPAHGSPRWLTSHVCTSVDVEDLRKFDHEQRSKTGNHVT